MLTLYNINFCVLLEKQVKNISYSFLPLTLNRVYGAVIIIDDWALEVLEDHSCNEIRRDISIPRNE